MIISLTSLENKLNHSAWLDIDIIIWCQYYMQIHYQAYVSVDFKMNLKLHVLKGLGFKLLSKQDVGLIWNLIQICCNILSARVDNSLSNLMLRILNEYYFVCISFTNGDFAFKCIQSTQI